VDEVITLVDLVVQIARVTSPLDHSVTHGHLCIKGRFDWQFVQIREKGLEAARPPVTQASQT
jgi:predicted molibdopterin-dependent oxidoreductase YjgC